MEIKNHSEHCNFLNGMLRRQYLKINFRKDISNILYLLNNIGDIFIIFASYNGY